jgi:hypothetical protein
VARGDRGRRVAGVVQLQARVHERAAVERAAAEPRLEHRERREQPRPRVVARLLDRVGQRGARRAVGALQRRDDQRVLGREVAVERHLAHAGLGRDPVDADGPDALAGEEPRRRLEHAVAGGAHRVKISLV